MSLISFFFVSYLYAATWTFGNYPLTPLKLSSYAFLCIRWHPIVVSIICGVSLKKWCQLFPLWTYSPLPYRSSISRHKPPQSTPTFTWSDQTGLAALCFYPSSFTHCRVIVRFTTSRPSYRVITAYPRQVRNRVEGQQSARFYWLSPKITNLCKVCSGLGVP